MLFIPSLRTSIILAFVLLLILTIWQAAGPLMVRAQTDSDKEYTLLDMLYLSQNIQNFEGQNIMTRGVVLKGYASNYMFEDFQLQARNNANASILVVTGSAGLSDPLNSSYIEIAGKIEYSNLEGGFYYLNASSWKNVGASQISTITPSPWLEQTPAPTPTAQPTLEPTSQPNNPLSTPTTNPQNPQNSNFLGEYGFVIAAVEVIAIAATAAGFILYKRRK